MDYGPYYAVPRFQRTRMKAQILRTQLPSYGNSTWLCRKRSGLLIVDKSSRSEEELIVPGHRFLYSSMNTTS
eukprot:scaffold1888_cov120-Cylindrotheca_fusiformis.AAC.9